MFFWSGVAREDRGVSVDEVEGTMAIDGGDGGAGAAGEDDVGLDARGRGREFAAFGELEGDFKLAGMEGVHQIGGRGRGGG